MAKPCIVVDLCNTCADVNGVLDTIGPKRALGVYEHPVVSGEDFFVNNLWIFNEAAPIPGMRKALEQLSRWYNIIYLTARPIVSDLLNRRWLQNNYFTPGMIIYSPNKAEVALSLNARFAIDDSPYEIERYRSAGIDCLVPAQDYNVGYDNRFDADYFSQLLTQCGAMAFLDALLTYKKMGL